MSSNYSSRAQSIDYDAIMRSIKLDKKTETFPISKHIHCEENKEAEHQKEHKHDNYDTFNKKEEINSENNKVKDCENVYKSVVFDDYCQESCFESIFRNFEKEQTQNASRKMVGEKTCDKNDFRFYYDDFRGKKEEEKEEVCTPKHLKRERKQKTYFYEEQNEQHIKSQDKENNNNHNTIQEPANINQFRYLSHTETSQKKITKKSIIIATKNSEKPKSIAKPKRQTKRPGIELIYDNVYQRA